MAKHFKAIVHGECDSFDDAESVIEAAYAAGVTDEFVEPVRIGDYEGMKGEFVGEFGSGKPPVWEWRTTESAFCFNFRPDRMRQLCAMLLGKNLPPEAEALTREYGRPIVPFRVDGIGAMTEYDPSLGMKVAFRKDEIDASFGEVISRAGLKQFRCAETEKYAHVTYFFNGGHEAAFEGEERKVIPSPRDVPTYDKKPEMSAAAVGDAVTEAIESDAYDFVLVNFANPDMVGHTGILDAARQAVEAVDAAVGKIEDAVRAKGGALIVTADHGNCETMADAEGNPHTAHTTNPVPFYYVNDRDREIGLRKGGRLSDVAPTMLEILGLESPPQMTGKTLRVAKKLKRPRQHSERSGPTDSSPSTTTTVSSPPIARSTNRRAARPMVRAAAPKVASAPRIDEALVREAAMLTRVRHAHVAVLYDAIVDGNRRALALEDPAGPSLEQALERLDASGGLSTEQAMAVTLAIAEAVAEMHALGIVYGSVVPARHLPLQDARARARGLRPGERSAARARGGARLGRPRLPVPRRGAGRGSPGRERRVLHRSRGLSSARGQNRRFERELAARARGDRPPSIDLSRRVSYDIERAVSRALSRQAGPRQGDAAELVADLEAALGRGFAKTHHLTALFARASSDDRLDRAGRGAAAPVEPASSPATSSLAARLGVVLAVMCAVAIGAEAIERSASKPASSLGKSSTPGFLKVLAHPWADIWIDGNYADTTPIGKPIELRSGRHTVFFKHPRATDERRIVDIEPGATVTLDVELRVVAPPVDAGVDASP